MRHYLKKKQFGKNEMTKNMTRKRNREGVTVPLFFIVDP